MNPFFQSHHEFKMPGRVYARLIEWRRSDYALFDAIDADWFDRERRSARGTLSRNHWHSLSDKAPVYSVEVNARLGDDHEAFKWLALRPMSPLWSEIRVVEAPHGPARLYGNINGPSLRIGLAVGHISADVLTSLKRLSDLSPYASSRAELRRVLPSNTIERIFVLDVGQGAASALVTKSNEVVAYVDVGAGVLADAGTWPSAMTGFCVKDDPVIVLTHWHYDHFHGANKLAGLLSQTWIAPFQSIGPGPQAVMASAIAQSGKLQVWNGSGTLKTGAIELERCSGPSGNFNRSGIAAWIDGPDDGDNPILLPGDAGYTDIPSLKSSPARAITALTASHHGGRASGKAPKRPNVSVARVAMSYGTQNSYKHPLAPSITKLQNAGWKIGFPNAAKDDRRTEDRGQNKLGTIGLRWPASSTNAYPCNCGCSIDPTQY